MNFNVIKIAVAKQFDRMKDYQLFRTSVEKDKMWETYLGSFPEGTNPIYKERTEHDCNCCKSFIRTIGNVVAIIDGKLESIWDVKIPAEPAYQVVADALAELVKSQPIANVFVHTEKVAGVDKNFQQLLDGKNGVKAWEHFFVNLPKVYVVKGDDIGTMLSDTRATHDVFKRSLEEITPDAVETVLELIAQNSIYRGEEHRFAVVEFQKHQKTAKRAGDLDLYIWSKIKGVPQSITRIRNTAIGTLLVDLSEGKELEDAVKSFEAKVAPTNYKRPTALVTKAMIEKAQKKIQELGLMSALERRYANISDITINNVIFADRSAKKNMGGNVFEELAAAMPEKVKNFDKVEEINIEKFLTDIVPKAESIEVMVENRHVSNLVSLVAPIDPTAGGLFKWDNNFSWSYNGELADSIKERVKKAGGNVTGDLCCRLAWYNRDDLDFHMAEPGGYEIWYSNKRRLSPCQGMLDVDANGGDGLMLSPVENIYYQDRTRMKEGTYKLMVHNYSKRQTVDEGFEVEIDYLGTVHHFAYAKPVKNGEFITVAEFKYTHANGIEIIESLPSSQATKTVWNIPTQAFHKVDAIMLSPNHWDSNAGPGVGNKHYFFMLENCLNDGKARGFFNEFLKLELDAHRKTFEMVGSKMKTDETDNQLSGLGFSSTQRNYVLVKIKGAFTRTVKVMF